MNGWVSGQIYHDVNIGYRTPITPGHGLLSKVFGNITIQAGVKNVFNTKPAFYVDYNQGLIYSPYGDPRLRDFWVSIKKEF